MSQETTATTTPPEPAAETEATPVFPALEPLKVPEHQPYQGPGPRGRFWLDQQKPKETTPPPRRR